jgi:hypothetical protein
MTPHHVQTTGDAREELHSTQRIVQRAIAALAIHVLDGYAWRRGSHLQ